MSLLIEKGSKSCSHRFDTVRQILAPTTTNRLDTISVVHPFAIRTTDYSCRSQEAGNFV